MADATKSTVAFVGCGNISGPYAESLARHAELTLLGAFDIDANKRAEFAERWGCAAYESLDQLRADEPDIVVNLTSAPYHYDTTKELLEAGHTVFSEKPLALAHNQADELVALAEQKGLRLACAPSLWLSQASREAARRVQGGELGTVRVVTAEVNQGRIETWHPAPLPFFGVGPVVDAGVYPLAYLTAVLGPIREVSSISAMSLADRRTVDNEEFTPGAADTWLVAARFESGALLRLTCTFYVQSATIPRAIDFHGDEGSLRLRDWIKPGSGIDLAPYGEAFAPVTIDEPDAPIDWCLGLAELAAAIRDGRDHAVSARHAAHIVEVLDATRLSAEEGRRVHVHSNFAAPSI